jgi:hypothetical protein
VEDHSGLKRGVAGVACNDVMSRGSFERSGNIACMTKLIGMTSLIGGG